MKFVLMSLLFVLVSCHTKKKEAVEVSPDLQEAWTIVNSPEDIYQRHDQIEQEIEMIEGQLSQTEVVGSAVADLDNRKMSAEEELKAEEAKVISTQKKVEQASAREIRVLSSQGK